MLIYLLKLGSAGKVEVTAAEGSSNSKRTLTPAEEEEKRKQEEQWRADLTRVSHILLKIHSQC
jgi:hypothetical protein